MSPESQAQMFEDLPHAGRIMDEHDDLHATLAFSAWEGDRLVGEAESVEVEHKGGLRNVGVRVELRQLVPAVCQGMSCRSG